MVRGCPLLIRILASRCGADYSRAMLKPLLLTLLVLGGPVQAQLARFCDVMEQAVGACCCGQDEQPVQQTPADCSEGLTDPCCRTFVSVGDEAASAAIPPASRQEVSAHDPPPLAPLPNAGLPQGERRAALSAKPLHPDLSGHGTRTYLRTLRLRL